jgi:predicted NUDIX family NTP pyrophosphohydrolase
MREPKTSAGILAYRWVGERIEFLLAHPGGPFYHGRDEGVWTIPKGEYDVRREDPIAAAVREFCEETGFVVSGDLLPLTPRRMRSGKIVSAWALNSDFPADDIVSNCVIIEWPHGSGKRLQVPEVDRAGWFGIDEALRLIVPRQGGFLTELVELLVP